MLLVIASLLVVSSLAYVHILDHARFNIGRLRDAVKTDGEEYVPFMYKPRPKLVFNEQKKIRIQQFDKRDNIISVCPLISVSPKKRAKNIAYNSLQDIVSCSRNKLLTLYSTCGCKNWHDKIYSLGLCDEYYALCLTCTWNNPSKAFLQTIKQIHGYQKIERDPPFAKKKAPPPKVDDLIEEYVEEKRIYDQYIAEKRLCQSEGREPPPRPDFRSVVTFKKYYPHDNLQTKVLDYIEEFYKINFIEPDYWRITFNKHFNKMYNMFHNELLKRPANNSKLPDIEQSATNNKLINFLLVPITDSQLIKNKNKLNRVFKRKMYSHAKKIIFHEIILKLLIENNIKYSDMPAILLYRLRSTPDFAKLTRDDGMEALGAAQLLDYKCKKLVLNTVFSSDQLEFVGKIGGFSTIDPLAIEKLDDLLSKRAELPLPWEKTPLDPLLSLIYISYQYHLRKLIDDAKPKFNYQFLYPKKTI